MATIVFFIFTKTWICFFSFNFPSFSLHLLQHWLLDRASPLVGITSSWMVGGFVV